MRRREIDEIVNELIEPNIIENLVENLITDVKIKASIEEGDPWTHCSREALRKIRNSDDAVKNSVIDYIIVKLVNLR